MTSHLKIRFRHAFISVCFVDFVVDKMNWGAISLILKVRLSIRMTNFLSFKNKLIFLNLRLHRHKSVDSIVPITLRVRRGVKIVNCGKMNTYFKLVIRFYVYIIHIFFSIISNGRLLCIHFVAENVKQPSAHPSRRRKHNWAFCVSKGCAEDYCAYNCCVDGYCASKSRAEGYRASSR